MIMTFVLYTVIFQIVIFATYFVVKRYWKAETILAKLCKTVIFVPVIMAQKLYPGNDSLFFFVNFGILVLWGAILTFIDEKKKAKQKIEEGELESDE